jgi:hypothetical protein
MFNKNVFVLFLDFTVQLQMHGQTVEDFSTNNAGEALIFGHHASMH